MGDAPSLTNTRTTRRIHWCQRPRHWSTHRLLHPTLFDHLLPLSGADLNKLMRRMIPCQVYTLFSTIGLEHPFFLWDLGVTCGEQHPLDTLFFFFSEQYPSLYNIVQHKNVLVSTVLANTPLNITFRRGLNDHKWLQWLHLCQRLISINLTTEPDSFMWKLTDSGLFTVKSMYLDLMNGHTRFLRKYLWKLKIPLKIKIFMWFLSNKVLLTKDNLVKRKWNGCKKCCFCDSAETINHLFLSCPFAKIIWRIVYCAYNIPPPTNITNMFGKWLNGVSKIDKDRIRIGVSEIPV